MKCPKCSYLGFETGDRCKNCGYDFSLLAATTSSPQIDAELNIRGDDDGQPTVDLWLDRIEATSRASVGARTAPEAPAPAASATTVATVTPPAQPRDLSFPLFSPRADEENDEPLIKLPAAPRPPLSVRRTPDQPRLRSSPRISEPEDGRLSLEAPDIASGLRISGPASSSAGSSAAATRKAPEPEPQMVVSSLPRRAGAGLIDLAILSGIDFVILYSTLRMSALTFGEWAQLPAVPMVAFLVLLKLSYFGAFTAACGQTIGKMAMRIRVVADDAHLDPARAARRTIVSAVSFLAVGAGFIPVFVDPERRALHDRIAGTRVVELPSI
jgi:uncharacterized RDD family membrane protein YckC